MSFNPYLICTSSVFVTGAGGAAGADNGEGTESESSQAIQSDNELPEATAQSSLPEPALTYEEKLWQACIIFFNVPELLSSHKKNQHYVKTDLHELLRSQTIQTERNTVNNIKFAGKKRVSDANFRCFEDKNTQFPWPQPKQKKEKNKLIRDMGLKVVEDDVFWQNFQTILTPSKQEGKLIDYELWKELSDMKNLLTYNEYMAPVYNVKTYKCNVNALYLHFFRCFADFSLLYKFCASYILQDEAFNKNLQKTYKFVNFKNDNFTKTENGRPVNYRPVIQMCHELFGQHMSETDTFFKTTLFLCRVYNDKNWKLGSILRIDYATFRFYFKISDMFNFTDVSIYCIVQDTTLKITGITEKFGVRVQHAATDFLNFVKNSSLDVDQLFESIEKQGVQTVATKYESISLDNLKCLKKKGWLNDHVIDWWMKYWCDKHEKTMLHNGNEKETGDAKDKAVVASSMFYQNLRHELKEGRGVPNSYFAANLFKAKMLLIPVHIDENHWILAKMTFVLEAGATTSAILQWYDSSTDSSALQRDPHEPHTQNLEKWLQTKQSGLTLTWHTTGRYKDQNNTDDCGVWVCMYAMFLSMEQECFFKENAHVDFFRAWLMQLIDETGKDGGGQSNTLQVPTTVYNEHDGHVSFPSTPEHVPAGLTGNSGEAADFGPAAPEAAPEAAAAAAAAEAAASEKEATDAAKVADDAYQEARTEMQKAGNAKTKAKDYYDQAVTFQKQATESLSEAANAAPSSSNATDYAAAKDKADVAVQAAQKAHTEAEHAAQRADEACKEAEEQSKAAQKSAEEAAKAAVPAAVNAAAAKTAAKTAVAAKDAAEQSLKESKKAAGEAGDAAKRGETAARVAGTAATAASAFEVAAKAARDADAAGKSAAQADTSRDAADAALKAALADKKQAETSLSEAEKAALGSPNATNCDTEKKKTDTAVKDAREALNDAQNAAKTARDAHDNAKQASKNADAARDALQSALQAATPGAVDKDAVLLAAQNADAASKAAAKFAKAAADAAAQAKTASERGEAARKSAEKAAVTAAHYKEAAVAEVLAQVADLYAVTKPDDESAAAAAFLAQASASSTASLAAVTAANNSADKAKRFVDAAKVDYDQAAVIFNTVLEKAANLDSKDITGAAAQTLACSALLQAMNEWAKAQNEFTKATAAALEASTQNTAAAKAASDAETACEESPPDVAAGNTAADIAKSAKEAAEAACQNAENAATGAENAAGTVKKALQDIEQALKDIEKAATDAAAAKAAALAAGGAGGAAATTPPTSPGGRPAAHGGGAAATTPPTSPGAAPGSGPAAPSGGPAAPGSGPAAPVAPARTYGRRVYPIRDGVLTYYVLRVVASMPDSNLIKFSRNAIIRDYMKKFDLPPETQNVKIDFKDKRLARYQIAPITLEAEVTFTLWERDATSYDVFYCGMYEPGLGADKNIETLKSPPELPPDV